MVIIMAKRKKSKENKNKFSYSIEFTGLILILIGIIGFGFGYIGMILKKFAMFLPGTWWFVILAFLIIVGCYMLIKRSMPKFFSAKLIKYSVSHGFFTSTGPSAFVNNKFLFLAPSFFPSLP